jgi:hypothetical protein
MGASSSVTSQLALVKLHQMRQSFIDSVRGSADQADAFFNNWLGQNPAVLTIAVGSVETAADLATGASAIIEPISSGHTTLGNVAAYLQQHQQQADSDLTQAEIQNSGNVPALGGILATKALVDFSGMFVEPLKLGEGVLQGTPAGVATDALRLAGWAPGLAEAQTSIQVAEATTARELPAAANAVAQLSAELSSALPGGWCSQIVGVGKLLTGTAKGYMPVADLLESVPSAARARLEAGMGLTFGQVAAQVRSLGMKISQVTSVRDLRISDSAHMTQAVEDFVRQQGQLEVTFFSIGNDNLGHILGAFVDAEGTLRLFDVKGFYNGLGEVFASNPRLEGSWLRGLMSVQGTRYLPRWIDPETADAARSILSVVGIQVTPALIGDANATLDQMKSDFAAWQAGLKDTFGTNGNASAEHRHPAMSSCRAPITPPPKLPRRPSCKVEWSRPTGRRPGQLAVGTPRPMPRGRHISRRGHIPFRRQTQMPVQIPLAPTSRFPIP